MWLDILSGASYSFALFEVKYPHDTSEEWGGGGKTLSRQKCRPNTPPQALWGNASNPHSAAPLSDKITYLNLELGQALRLALRSRSNAWKTLCLGNFFFRPAWKVGGHLTQFDRQWMHLELIVCRWETTLPALRFAGTLRKILFDVSGSSISKKENHNSRSCREKQRAGVSVSESLPTPVHLLVISTMGSNQSHCLKSAGWG